MTPDDDYDYQAAREKLSGIQTKQIINFLGIAWLCLAGYLIWSLL